MSNDVLTPEEPRNHKTILMRELSANNQLLQFFDEDSADCTSRYSLVTSGREFRLHCYTFTSGCNQIPKTEFLLAQENYTVCVQRQALPIKK